MKQASKKIAVSRMKLGLPKKKLNDIREIILVGSGKGGVGKSFVACGLALRLANAGYRVGLYDADIHGASVPNYLGLKPPLISTKSGLEPKTFNQNLKVASVSLLTGNYPVPMRGKEKEDLIIQFFSLTNWGKMDFLIVDLPPGTGDELLSIFSVFGTKSRLILVTTPSKNVVEIVSRLSMLAKREKIPIGGIALNMAYYSKPLGSVEYPFGKPEDDFIQDELKSRIIARIPLEQAINESKLSDIITGHNEVADQFQLLLNHFTA